MYKVYFKQIKMSVSALFQNKAIVHILAESIIYGITVYVFYKKTMYNNKPYNVTEIKKLGRTLACYFF